MAKIVKLKETLADALDVKTVWEKVPDFKMGSISLNDFIAARDVTESLDKEYATKDVELSGVKANRDEKARELGQLVTRFRSGIRSAYGPDSVMYEQAGGTRSSLRKSPTARQAEATAATTAEATSHA